MLKRNGKTIENNPLVKIEINPIKSNRTELHSILVVLQYFYNKVDFVSNTFFHYFPTTPDEANYFHLSMIESIY